MKRVVFFSILSVCAFSSLWAEGEDTAPKTRKRSRFLIYDVKPVLIGKDSTNILPEEEKTKPDVTREALKGISLPSGENATSAALGARPLPVLPILSGHSADSSAEEAEDEEEDASWISPMDFMAGEDLMEEDPSLELEEPEEENQADWDQLEKNLQEEQNPEDAFEKEQEGEMEFSRQEDPTRSPISTGLQLSNVISESASGTVDADSDSLAGSGSAGLDQVESQDSVLTPAMQLNAPQDRANPSERSSRAGLQGSQALFSEFRDRWQPQGTSATSASSTAAVSSEPTAAFDSPLASPLESSAVRVLGQVPSGTSPATSVGVSGALRDPSPVLRQSNVFQPTRPEPSASLVPPRTDTTTRAPSGTVNTFQRRETGVRSRIGELPGMRRP